jgi:dolichyl-diphosphooligosaccharide--protein glycosyltransferase
MYPHSGSSYGYQIAAMANRTTLVDNNTWNNSHIATVGRIFAKGEREAADELRRLGVDYVLVVFGGQAQYSSDDIAKFLWMVRIASSVYPDIREHDYLNAEGVYRVDEGGSQTMLDSLMFRLCYYRFEGSDRVRGSAPGKTGFRLREFEEVFTSHNWITRIYRVRPKRNRRWP